MINKKIKFQKILVVAGGWSDEREVSILSGENVFSSLKKNKYKKFVILDIPLLLENNLDKKNDILIFIQSERSKILSGLVRNVLYQILLIFY